MVRQRWRTGGSRKSEIRQRERGKVSESRAGHSFGNSVVTWAAVCKRPVDTRTHTRTLCRWLSNSPSSDRPPLTHYTDPTTVVLCTAVWMILAHTAFLNCCFFLQRFHFHFFTWLGSLYLSAPALHDITFLFPHTLSRVPNDSTFRFKLLSHCERSISCTLLQENTSSSLPSRTFVSVFSFAVFLSPQLSCCTEILAFDIPHTASHDLISVRFYFTFFTLFCTFLHFCVTNHSFCVAKYILNFLHFCQQTDWEKGCSRQFSSSSVALCFPLSVFVVSQPLFCPNSQVSFGKVLEC